MKKQDVTKLPKKKYFKSKKIKIDKDELIILQEMLEICHDYFYTKRRLWNIENSENVCMESASISNQSDIVLLLDHWKNKLKHLLNEKK